MCDSRVQVHAPPFSFVILVQGQRHAAQTAVAWKPGARHRVDVGHVLEARPPTPDHSKGAFMVKYSLVGYDGSDASRRAFQFAIDLDRKSTRLNSSHPSISYAVFCLKKKKNTN